MKFVDAIKCPFLEFFSDSVGLPLQWSIEEVCAQIVKKHTQVAAERNLKFRNHLLSTVELLQLIPDHVPAITFDPLAPNWFYNRRVKRKYLPWEETALAIGQETSLTSVSERSLQFWKNLDVDSIRNLFKPAATAKRQFKSKRAFFANLIAILDNYLHFLDVSPLKLMHFVAPEWSQDFPVCFHCGIPINYMKSPAKIFRTCKQVHALDPAVCNPWRAEILHLILDPDSILCKF